MKTLFLLSTLTFVTSLLAESTPVTVSLKDPDKPIPVITGTFSDWHDPSRTKTHIHPAKPSVNATIAVELELPKAAYDLTLKKNRNLLNFCSVGGPAGELARCIINDKSDVSLYIVHRDNILDILPIVGNGQSSIEVIENTLTPTHISTAAGGTPYSSNNRPEINDRFINKRRLYEFESQVDFPKDFTPNKIYGLREAGKDILQNPKTLDLQTTYSGGLFSTDKGYVIDLSKNPELASGLARKIGEGSTTKKATSLSYPLSISGIVTIRPAIYAAIGVMEIENHHLRFKSSYYCVDVIGVVTLANSSTGKPNRLILNDRFVFLDTDKPDAFRYLQLDATKPKEMTSELK